MHLLDGFFRSPSVEPLFSDSATVQAILDFEAALARAQARSGIVSESAAAAIASCCRVEQIDLQSLAQAMPSAGNLAIPLLKQLNAIVARKSPDASRYVHFGATSQDALDTALVLQFGGAAGTLAALGDRGPKIAQLLAEELAIPLPRIPWHGQRERIAETAATFGLLAGTSAKIARDLSLYMQTEVAELAEPPSAGRGGSSSMPHKQNPVASAAILASATLVPALVSTALAALSGEYQRSLGAWQSEWEVVPEIVRLTAGGLHQLAALLPGLHVNTEKMRSN